MENNHANPAPHGYGPLPAVTVREGRALSASRAAVLDALRAGGDPVTLNDLARSTGLHANTLREHLDALVARRLARRTRETPKGRGRPAWLYEATDPDVEAAGTEYAGLAATLAAHIHRTSANPREDAIAAGRSWGRELARRAGKPSSSSAVAARRTTARLLDDVGFAPETDARATVSVLTRCPLLETAKEYPDVVCGVHLGIVRGALDEYGADSSRTDLHPFSEPHGCRLELLTGEPR